MIKMYHISIQQEDEKQRLRSYTVGEKEKNFLIKALSGYNLKVEEVFIEEQDVSTIAENKTHPPSN